MLTLEQSFNQKDDVFLISIDFSAMDYATSFDLLSNSFVDMSRKKFIGFANLKVVVHFFKFRYILLQSKSIYYSNLRKDICIFYQIMYYFLSISRFCNVQTLDNQTSEKSKLLLSSELFRMDCNIYRTPVQNF